MAKYRRIGPIEIVSLDGLLFVPHRAPQGSLIDECCTASTLRLVTTRVKDPATGQYTVTSTEHVSMRCDRPLTERECKGAHCEDPTIRGYCAIHSPIYCEVCIASEGAVL
jgi:hypothetical protein